MKRLIPFLALAILASPQASAAPKPIAVGLGSIYNVPVGSEGMVLSGKNSIFFQSINQITTDILITALDATRTQIWQRTIDSNVDEIATAATVDPSGNIWLSGALALPILIETATPTLGIDNPDNVTIEKNSDLRPDMTSLGLWKISPTGELLATYQLSLSAVPIVNALAVNNTGISIVGVADSKPFFITATLTGLFSKPLYLGTSKSEFNAVTRYSDGSSSIFGSSAETLAGKKLAGVRDGVLIKVSKSGAISNIVRSSANKASRSWLSGDSSNLVSGPVVTGGTVESAITKFTPTFTPTWTYRVPSVGASTSLTGGGNSYLAFTSRGSVVGVSQWKPAQPSLLILTFDSKGVLKAATALPGLVKPLSLQYSPIQGVVGLASASDGTVSSFTLVSR